MTARIRWQIGIGAVLLVLLIYGTRGILLPFVAGLAVAYLLDPLADRLEALRFPRWLATTVVLVAFFVGAGGIALGMLPIVQDQVLGIVENLPRYIAAVRPVLDNILAKVGESFHIGTDTDSMVAAIADQGLSRLGTMATGIITRGAALFNLVTLLLISPVVAFFLLRDWDLIVARVDSWLPAGNRKTVRMLAKGVDEALAGFVRGQTLVSLTMAVLYAIGWTAVGLKYGLILGLLAGIMAYVPFVGALFAMVIAMIVGLGQFGADPAKLGMIFGVFAFVQLIEGAYLTPKLIGSRVGLHPVWVLFAIFAGGEVMGFVGVLIALPLAAAVGVLVRYGIDQYEGSAYYGGPDAPEPAVAVAAEVTGEAGAEEKAAD